ncbi:MAG: STAS domain-containing protein [Actinobacteria bacterium]|nr:MAG: STAS domain-containing protein [Actinomycetota bacterium]
MKSVIPPFDARITQQGRLRIVRVAGEVDILTAPKLAATVRDDDAFDTLVLDVAKMPFITLHRRLSRRGGGVALASVQPFVARVLEIVGLADTLPIAPDVRTATRLLAAQHA